MHSVNSFVTLTYSDKHYRPDLHYPDFQNFMKRLRKAESHRDLFGNLWHLPIRFFMAGEYGELRGRPHFHALLFGVGFPDLVPCGNDLYSSRALESVWPFGYASVGEVNYATAAYVARYAVKKITGDRAGAHYNRLDTRTGELLDVPPEFGQMSRNPGIGKPWFDKYWRDMYVARDGYCTPGGFTLPPPRAYDRYLEALDPDLAASKEVTRYESSLKFASDTTPARLAVREACAIDKFKRKKGKLL